MRIIKIRNPQLFEELKKSDDKWKVLFEDYELKDERIPRLTALDHIEEKTNMIIFHDRGCAKAGGWISDNTFAIVK